ncbi:MAG TPA: FKBP-type peptidyl-prolyl cis-trans isomerase [Opitutaceae bacterium]
MRSVFVLALLGVVFATIAIVVRSGMLARKNPGQPINSAMREAYGVQELPARDATVIAQKYPGARSTPSGLRYIVREAGTGTETPKPGQIVSVHYEATFLDGTKFDSSYDKGKGPFNFTYGTGAVILGWDDALSTMKRGEKRTLIVPYWLAYGEKGIRGKIQPKATLIFELELIDIK